MLEDVPIFHSVPSEGLELLERRARRRVFSPGTELMRQGDSSDSLHVILSGQVDVVRTHRDLLEPVVLATLGSGEVVGEIGVLDGGPRTATVRAVEETQTLQLTAEQVADVILRYPDATRTLLRTVSARLRNAAELAEELARRKIL